MRLILTTSRLLVRELEASDVDFVAEMLGDAQVMRYWPAPLTRQRSVEWIEKQIDRYARHGCGYWLAIEKPTDLPVGQVGVMMTSVDGAEEAALGWIIHRPFWRRGFAFEGASACIDHVFGAMNRDRAVALIRRENHPSTMLALKLGMEPGKTTVHAGLEHVVFAKPVRRMR